MQVYKCRLYHSIDCPSCAVPVMQSLVVKREKSSQDNMSIIRTTNSTTSDPQWRGVHERGMVKIDNVAFQPEKYALRGCTRHVGDLLLWDPGPHEHNYIAFGA